MTSLEAVEHVYFPCRKASAVFAMLEPEARGNVSKLYDFYIENLLLTVTGKLDAPFAAFWDHDQSKFWSMDTPGRQLHEARLSHIRFDLVGRIPVLAKSMISVVRKP